MPSGRPISLAAVNEDEAASKRIFAAALLRSPHDAMGAAKRAFPGKSLHGRAIEAANTWPTDATVLAIMDELTTDDSLPSREHVAREVWALAMNPEANDRDRIAAFKLYGEVMGSLAPEGTVGNPLADLFDRIAAGGRPEPATAK